MTIFKKVFVYVVVSIIEIKTENLRNIFNPLKKQFSEKTGILKIFFANPFSLK